MLYIELSLGISSAYCRGRVHSSSRGIKLDDMARLLLSITYSWNCFNIMTIGRGVEPSIGNTYLYNPRLSTQQCCRCRLAVVQDLVVYFICFTNYEFIIDAPFDRLCVYFS